MKRKFTFAIGICIIAVASAVDKADRTSIVKQPISNASADFGLVTVEKLTTEQRELLQNKYRYWPSSNVSSPKSPL